MLGIGSLSVVYSYENRCNPLLSNWDETLIFRWLYPRKIVDFSENDKRGIKALIDKLKIKFVKVII